MGFSDHKTIEFRLRSLKTSSINTLIKYKVFIGRAWRTSETLAMRDFQLFTGVS